MKLLFDSNYRFAKMASWGFCNSLSDEEFIKRMFKSKTGLNLNLEKPKMFSEKLQWLNLYNRQSDYTLMVDKYSVRQYVSDKIGKDFLIPLLGVWNTPDDIDFDKLPDKFVLKCNHNSGLGMFICKDKSIMNVSQVKKSLKLGLSQNYYLSWREWPYKDVERKIICEKYMEDDEGELKDYKFFCFHGQVEYCQLIEGRFTKITKDFYDREWNHMDFSGLEGELRQSPRVQHKPDCFDEMIRIAEMLSENIPFVRVDLYCISQKIYFGELTFFPAAGFGSFSPTEWNYKIGDKLLLPEEKLLNN